MQKIIIPRKKPWRKASYFANRDRDIHCFRRWLWLVVLVELLYAQRYVIKDTAALFNVAHYETQVIKPLPKRVGLLFDLKTGVLEIYQTQTEVIR